jgi:acetyl-CoA carboxylase beta subunit
VKQEELEKYMMEQLPETFDKSEGTVMHGIIAAVAAGIVKAKETEAKEVAVKVLKQLGDQSLKRGQVNDGF